MNFLLVFLIVLMNCTEYEITHSDYDSIKQLMPNPHEIELYKEISTNPKFSCYFKVNEENEDMKEIKIIDLDNTDPETGNNIFPEFFCEINNIKCLILNGLKLFKLPNQFEKFKELEELNLNYNEFKEFPQVLFSLPKLRTLHLNANKFDRIPSEIIQMNSLEILSIACCYNLINISLNLFKLKSLKQLNLQHNRLLFKNNDFIGCPVYSDDRVSTEKESNDSVNFVSYKSLKKLIIRGNGLSVFPCFFCNFINLEEIDISINLFEEIPYEIHSFTSLEILNISYNRIEKIIIKNGMFNNLLKLYLEHNRITELSVSNTALQSLEILDLSCNKILKLDKNIFQLKRLKNLLVFGIVFTEIEKFPCIRSDSLRLKLTLKDISVLPNLFWYNCIRELTVECKEQVDREIDIFEHVPTNSKIDYLDLARCFLTSIPHGISKLINLETFKAEFNEIIILENVFTGITSLKVLDLSFNQITNIERSIFDIITLEELKLYSNRIELLPSNINNMNNRNLQIDLHRNPLRLYLFRNWDNPELIFLNK